MKKYISENPVFSDEIDILETTDDNNAGNFNVATKELYENTLVLQKQNQGIGTDIDGISQKMSEILDEISPKLTVEADAGSAITIKDGETVLTGETDENGTFTAALPHTGTWTVEASLDGETADGSIFAETVGGTYTIELSYFRATLDVTAVPGAEVTAASGETVYHATAGNDGTAALTVKRSGTYTVSASYSGAESEAKSVDVTGYGENYHTEVAFLTLTLTAPDESNITVENGETKLTEKSTGEAIVFYLPNTGEWTVSATNGSEETKDTVNVEVYKNYTIELAYIRIYGVVWDKTDKTTLSRTDDAALFTDPTPAVNGSGGSSPFDGRLPWSGMVKETIGGNELVKIPKYWYKWTDDGDSLKLQIADKEVSGFAVSPAHADRGDGKGERDYVYIARYKCSSADYKSVSGKTPMVNITRATARTSIAALGSGYYQQDFAMFWTTRMLYLVEFADWDGQKVVGFDCGNNSSVEASGSTDSMDYHTGTILDSRETYGVGVQYRWIEDMWGNAYEWCDGIRFSGADVYVFKNPSEYSDTDGGTKTGTRPTSSGDIKGWGIPTASGYEWALYPSEVSGTDYTIAVADYCHYSSSGVVLRVGGYYGQGRNFGPFYLSGGNAASDADGSISARLQYLP